MQYMHHSFYSNFEGSVESGDVEFSLDLWTNEVSDLIVHEKKKVIDLLNKINISSKETDSYEEIADKILNNIGNIKLNRGISFLIAESNKIVSENDKDWKNKVDKISNSYQDLLKSVSEKPALKFSVKTDLMQHMKSKGETSGVDGTEIYKEATPQAINKKRNKKILFWSVIVIGGIALTWYLVNQYKKGQAIKLAEGGSLDNLNPIPTPPITAPMPPPTVAPKVVQAPIQNTAPIVTPTVAATNVNVTPPVSGI